MTDEHQGASGAPRSAIGRRQAEVIAREAHAGQRDKFEGVDYIRHVERVVALVEGDEAKTVAWLHDVVEDNPEWTFDRLENEGIPRHLIRAVSMLTRRQPYTYADYIDDIATDGNPLAITVKLADLRDHLREESWDRVPAGMLKRYTLAFLKLTALRACADAIAPADENEQHLIRLYRENKCGDADCEGRRYVAVQTVLKGWITHADAADALSAEAQARSLAEPATETIERLRADALAPAPEIERLRQENKELREAAVTVAELHMTLRERAEAAEQRLADALAPPEPKKCVIGEYCHDHGFIHGAEAEELRERIEGLLGQFLIDESDALMKGLRMMLDDVDARDSAAFVSTAEGIKRREFPAPPRTDAPDPAPDGMDLVDRLLARGDADSVEAVEAIREWRDLYETERGLRADALAPPEPNEICICAAIQFADGRIVRGHRHDSCFRTAEGWTPKPPREHVQGFITSRNRFVDRHEGARLQNEAGLISAMTGHAIEGYSLFSEDLYFDKHDHAAMSAPPRADALDASWHTAALLKDRTRRVIRERCQAGEAHSVIAQDYGVPEAFVTHLAAWQLLGDALDAPSTDTPERP